MKFAKSALLAGLALSLVALVIFLVFRKSKVDRFEARFKSFSIIDDKIDAALKPVANDDTARSPVSISEQSTTFNDLLITKWKLSFLKDDGVSGPFSIVSDQEFIFVSRCGLLSKVKKDGQKFSLVSQKPLPFLNEILCDNGPTTPFSGVKGMWIDAKTNSLFVSYHYLEKNDCVSLRISKMRFDPESLGLQDREIIFQSSPCIARATAVYTQAGGVFTEDYATGNVYFSVGDFGLLPNAQNQKLTYGGIWKYEADKKSAVRLAIGSRNAQGLDFSSQDSTLYESEHGPKGGDEINTVESGDNLGWPKSSYGVEYNFGADTDTYSGQLNNHRFGKKPIFAFFPSEALTGLRVYPRNSHFKNWGDDLIVLTIKAQNIYRLKIDERRVVYSEPIAKLEDRLRSLAVSKSGFIYIKADPDVLIEVRSSFGADFDQFARGKALSVTCLICHSVKGIGPNLFGQSRKRLLDAINAFHSGARKSDVMSYQVSSLSLSRREALAEYFSKAKGSRH